LLIDDRFGPSFEGFKRGMAELGYVEDRNTRYELLNAKGNRSLLPEFAERLAGNKPDLIVAASSADAAALARVTKDTGLPVIFLSVANPLALARSYASSGNNFTGISASTIDLTEKRLELLTELVTGIKTAIALHHVHGPNFETHRQATRKSAKRFGLDLTEITVAGSDELTKRAAALLTRRAGEAIIYPPDPIVAATQAILFPLAIKERMPSVAASLENVKAGALATYAADYFALGQQGAVLGAKILRGSKPQNLPIEQPFKLKLAINLKTARAIGLRIPKEILIRTDEVVE
jgi:putative ABC transport system substrate-binding protein